MPVGWPRGLIELRRDFTLGGKRPTMQAAVIADGETDDQSRGTRATTSDLILRRRHFERKRMWLKVWPHETES